MRRIVVPLLVLLSTAAALTASAGDSPASSVAGPPAIAPIDSACSPVVGWLLARQRADGSFGATSARLPTTAFVVIALADERAAPRTPRLKAALRRSVEFLLSRQLDSGAFVEAGADHTTLALLALVALRDGAAADPPPAALARAVGAAAPAVGGARGAARPLDRGR